MVDDARKFEIRLILETSLFSLFKLFHLYDVEYYNHSRDHDISGLLNANRTLTLKNPRTLWAVVMLHKISYDSFGHLSIL